VTEVQTPEGPNVVVQAGPVQQVTVTSQAPQQVTVTQPVISTVQTQSQERVDVRQLGIVGPTGPQGAPGTAFAISYVLTNVSSWSQPHTFPYYPAVRLINDQGEEVEIEIEYPDAHTVYIEFPLPFTGTVILS
jgi:hypothetical protein